ncbi:Plug domain-containing protein [Methylobacillus glycogenes]|uniref:Plug domain-containing protein n=1 Tax=Methylobacillus glycogenes TaxID=406 RepID=UPI001F36089B|nr:Plug domain-containing protein [Methylobacillus glycogenes]
MGPAWAAEELNKNLDEATAKDDAREAEGARLQSVVVTSQKRAENAQDVPIPITVIGGDKIKDTALSSASQIGNYIPNLSAERNNGHGLPRWNLRGLYTGDPSAPRFHHWACITTIFISPMSRPPTVLCLIWSEWRFRGGRRALYGAGIAQEAR